MLGAGSETLNTAHSSLHIPVQPALAAAQQHEVWHHGLRYIQVNEPIHQVKTYEAHGEQNATVFVNVRRGYPAQLGKVFLAMK